MSCRHECECPSELHHELRALLDEFNAPIPRQTALQYMSRIESMLAEDEERDLEARGLVEWVPADRDLTDSEMIDEAAHFAADY